MLKTLLCVWRNQLMKIIKGMTSEQQKEVENILTPYIHSYSFYYYGSRVKGNFSAVSDLDILIDGNISSEELSKLKHEFNESIKLPFIVNLALKKSMDEYFYNLIKDDLVKIE